MKYRFIPPIKMIRIIVTDLKKITIEFANPSMSDSRPASGDKALAKHSSTNGAWCKFGEHKNQCNAYLKCSMLTVNYLQAFLKNCHKIRSKKVLSNLILCGIIPKLRRFALKRTHGRPLSITDITVPQPPTDGLFLLSIDSLNQ